MIRSRGESTAFVPREWSAYFSNLSAEQRRDISVRVCRAVLLACPLDELPFAEMMRSLEYGSPDPRCLSAVTELLERLESEYDRLVDNDESALLLRHPVIRDVYLKARAASVVKFALAGELTEMAYEAWELLGDLSEVQRLAGMR